MEMRGKQGLCTLALIGWSSLGVTIAQSGGENEIDHFMRGVLERRQENSTLRRQYVLDEHVDLQMVGPGNTSLWVSKSQYTWYERDGVFVRSPIRIEGKTIDERARTEYEDQWLQREKRKAQRGDLSDRSPTRMSRRSTLKNVRMAIKRLWGDDVSRRLIRQIGENARAWGDDHAAITAAAGHILRDRGGISETGLTLTLERVRDGFVMLENRRLYPDEVREMIDQVMLEIGVSPATATDAQFANFLELFELAIQFDLNISAPHHESLGLTSQNQGNSKRITALNDVHRRLSDLRESGDNVTSSNDTRSNQTNSGVDFQSLASLVPEPAFISDSFFFDFEFEPGNYFLAGREQWEGMELLRIEYYPKDLFLTWDDNGGDDGENDGATGATARLNKTSLVTLWIDQDQQQIVRYTFDNLGFRFLPGRWLVRLDDFTVSMTMKQPFEGIWLPDKVELKADMSLATGTYSLSATRAYSNYREATSGGRIRSIGPQSR